MRARERERARESDTERSRGRKSKGFCDCGFENFAWFPGLVVGFYVAFV